MIGHAGVLLIVTVAVVGVLHTVVPDHWAPIVVLARQQGWSIARTARSAAIAGLGHVTTTLLSVRWSGSSAHRLQCNTATSFRSRPQSRCAHSGFGSPLALGRKSALTIGRTCKSNMRTCTNMMTVLSTSIGTHTTQRIGTRRKAVHHSGTSTSMLFRVAPRCCSSSGRHRWLKAYLRSWQPRRKDRFCWA